MPEEPSPTLSDQPRWWSELTQLRQFTGLAQQFWPRYLACLAQLLVAERLVLLVKGNAQPPGWRRLLEWPAQAKPSHAGTSFLTRLEEVATHCARDDRFLAPAGGGYYTIAARVNLSRSGEECVLAGLLPEATEDSAEEALVRLELAAETPELYQANTGVRQAKADVEKLASALDLATLVNQETRFLAAALAFCNALADRFRCDRVSLGWLAGGYLRLRALSRTEKFDRQMFAAQQLEAAMEEAFDQDDEVVWPAPEGANVVVRDHERFAREQRVPYLCSLPLREGPEPVAAITCERQAGPFTALEVQQLRLAGDLVSRRLADLQRQDRWFGSRWATSARQGLAKVVGPEHTWAKVVTLGVAVAIGALFFVKVNYRVEGSFQLRSDEVAYLTAPFEGYLDQVLVRPGDTVEAGDRLLALKTAELELEESAALADLSRFQREAEKDRAARSLAEMRIAEAMADQARARLEMVRHRINQATIKAPFKGVVVEGDLRERLGAPVKQAEVLLRVARIDTLFVEAEVNERDIHEILGRTSGEIAFLSQPRNKFPVRIVTVEPAAVPKEQANVFLVRCGVESGVQSWWRPGMSGVCKFSVEKRTLFWILTHRTVDFLRLKLWW